MDDYQDLEALIERFRERGVELGTSENAPSNEWLERAEARLGRKLPPSYVWFLKNFGGGEILGEEIYSIYGIPFEEAVGGDVVFQYEAHQRAGTLHASEIPLSRNDFGELFVLETAESDETGECPVYLRRGEARELYSKNFGDFLDKRIRELLA